MSSSAKHYALTLKFKLFYFGRLLFIFVLKRKHFLTLSNTTLVVMKIPRIRIICVTGRTESGTLLNALLANLGGLVFEMPPPPSWLLRFDCKHISDRGRENIKVREPTSR